MTRGQLWLEAVVASLAMCLVLLGLAVALILGGS